MWPTENNPGIIVIVKDNTPMIRSCLDSFNLQKIVNLQPCDVRDMMRITERQVEIGADYSAACRSLDKLINLMGISGVACTEMCQNLNPTTLPTSHPSTQRPTNWPTMSKPTPPKPTLKLTKTTRKSTRKITATTKPITKKLVKSETSLSEPYLIGTPG